MTEITEAPGDWTWEAGEGISDECWTRWAYHQEWEIEIYTDPGHPVTVLLYEVLEIRQNGEGDVSPYPTKSEQFSNEEDAMEYARELMEEYGYDD